METNEQIIDGEEHLCECGLGCDLKDSDCGPCGGVVDVVDCYLDEDGLDDQFVHRCEAHRSIQ